MGEARGLVPREGETLDRSRDEAGDLLGAERDGSSLRWPGGGGDSGRPVLRAVRPRAGSLLRHGRAHDWERQQLPRRGAPGGAGPDTEGVRRARCRDAGSGEAGSARVARTSRVWTWICRLRRDGRSIQRLASSAEPRPSDPSAGWRRPLRSRQTLRPTRKKEQPTTKATITFKTFPASTGGPSVRMANQKRRAPPTTMRTAAINATTTLSTRFKQPERILLLLGTLPPWLRPPHNYTLHTMLLARPFPDRQRGSDNDHGRNGHRWHQRKSRGISPRPVDRSLRFPSLLGGLLQDEGNLQVDLVTGDAAILDHDVHVLDPGGLHVAQGLVGTIYAFLYGRLEAVRRSSAYLSHGCNSHYVYTSLRYVSTKLLKS